MTINIFIIKDSEVHAENENVNNNIEIAGQNEMETNVSIISIPIERCGKSHR
jgi:hypothetical protein